MLVTLSEVLQYAEEKRIGIGSFNTPNLEALQAVIGAAEKLELPVIIQFAQCHEQWIPLNVIGPIMVQVAKSSSVPVCVHLDHGETLEYLQQALDLGFTGIMYDGSLLSYEENVKNTQTAVKMALETGASVEAELGSMGRRESGSDDDTGETDETKIYTDPVQAAEFVKKTGIDALACSFGTTHGIYLSEPKLDFEVVRAVREKAGSIPVVMHGGSGVSRNDYRKAVDAGGAAALRISAETRNGAPLFFSSISLDAKDAMRENVITAMKMFAGID